MYTLGPSSDSPGPTFHGLRQYWQYFKKGAHLPDYDAGVTLGKADLANANNVGFDEINSVPGYDRDDGWDAKLDGYRDTTRKQRGPTSLSNGF